MGRQKYKQLRGRSQNYESLSNARRLLDDRHHQDGALSNIRPATVCDYSPDVITGVATVYKVSMTVTKSDEAKDAAPKKSFDLLAAGSMAGSPHPHPHGSIYGSNTSPYCRCLANSFYSGR